jgi:glutaredoxin
VSPLPAARPRRIDPRLLAALAASALLWLVVRGPAVYFDPRGGNPANHVLVYTTGWCPVCTRLRACLNRHGVPFEERDVEASWRWRREWSAAGGEAVPFILVGSEVAEGLHREDVEPLLARAGFRVDCWSAEARREDGQRATPNRRAATAR